MIFEAIVCNRGDPITEEMVGLRKYYPVSLPVA